MRGSSTATKHFQHASAHEERMHTLVMDCWYLSVGHKGDEDKGSWHVHGCVKMKSMSTMTAKNKHVQLFFRSCSKYRLQLQSQRRHGIDCRPQSQSQRRHGIECRSQSPSRQRHGITFTATLSHFPFSSFLEFIATLFSKGFFLFCEKISDFSSQKEGLTPTCLGIGYIYTLCVDVQKHWRHVTFFVRITLSLVQRQARFSITRLEFLLLCVLLQKHE